MSMLNSIRQGTADVKTVRRVQFAVLSPDAILQESVGPIYKHISKSGELPGTLNDPRLGATRTTRNAVTGLNNKEDPGIYGHCVLELPVYHPVFYKNTGNILKVVCPACSYIRETENVTVAQIQQILRVQNRPRSERLPYVTELLKKGGKATTCKFCKSVLPEVAIDKAEIMGFVFIYPNEENKKEKIKIPVDAKKVHHILKRISDQDADVLGFNAKTSRPEWMIITILPIAPPTMRPSVVTDSNKTSDDDITQSLHNILKFNNALKQARIDNPGLESNDVLANWRALQTQVAALINNETNAYATVCNRAHRPLKTIKARHKGKHGRVRSHLMGKRTNYSARSVITADPNLSIEEMGIPIPVAKVLTYPEYVNRYNRRYLTTLVRRGPDLYPGANEIKKPGQNFPIDIGCIPDRESLYLETGTIVYRHMIDGDIVFANRQPSLHKMNMMTHRARVLPARSLRISVNITPPYGADFDGDEMNTHLAQTEQARRELYALTRTPTQICSPQYNAPVVEAVQDTKVATYRASSEQTRGYAIGEKYHLNTREFMNLAYWITKTPGSLPGKSEKGWTMIDLFNAMLPPVTVTRKDSAGNKLSIVNGHMSVPESNNGVIVPMAKSTGLLGTNAGSIFHVAWNDLGANAARDLIDDLSRVMSQWLMISTLSVGLRDLVLPDVYMQEIEYDKVYYLEQAQILVDSLHNGLYTDELREQLKLGPRGLTGNDYEQFEQDMIYLLGKCRNRVQEYVVEHIYEYNVGEIYDNRFMSMVDSGSKGKPTNVVQIIGILGQQDMDGRVSDAYHRRPLCFVPKDDLSPEARGFIRNSYNEGLTFLEYIYHAQAGRRGIISTSIKTADTGYLQRKLVKRLEDISACYDGTVRKAGGWVVQYIYGGDGYDGSKIEQQKIPHVAYSLDELKMAYGYSKADWSIYHTIVTIDGDMVLDADEIEEDKQSVAQEVVQFEKDWRYLRTRYPYNLPDSIPSVINFDRLIDSFSQRLGIRGTLPHMEKDVILRPSYINQKLNEMRSTLLLPTTKHINKHCLRQFFSLLRSKLSSKSLIIKRGFNKLSFDALLEEIEDKFYAGLITPGEAVGILTAQSIGEPGTQMTLDAFHSTGSKVTVSGGVPRFKEVLSLTKTKTPSVTIYLKDLQIPDEISDATDGAKTIAEVDAFLLDLAQTDREQAKKLKKRFVDIYLNNKQESVFAIKDTFEYVKLGDMVTQSEIYYVADEASDPDFERLSELAEATTPTDPVIYPTWLLRFTLDRGEISKSVQKEIQELTHDISMDITYLYNPDDKDSPPVVRVTISADNGDITTLNTCETSLMNRKLRGVAGITKTTVRKEPKDIKVDGPDGRVYQRNTPEHTEMAEIMMGSDNYIIDTIGSNLSDILAMENVDPYRTYTNDINEMRMTYGIEVGRRSIIRETQEVLVNSGADIDIRHIELLADAMTCRGFMQKIDHSGAKKGEAGPLALSSFEETTTILCEAAMYGQEDNMTGVSSSVMFGQFIKMGTNSFDVYLDEPMVMKHGTALPAEHAPSAIPAVVDTRILEVCKDEAMEFDFTL